MFRVIIWYFSLTFLILSVRTCNSKSASTAEWHQKNNPFEIASSKCNAYAAARYVNITYMALLPGDEDIRRRELNCIQSESLINAENAASLKEFPHIAIIGYGSDNPTAAEWKCGGSLISEQYILSAAHCALQDGSPARPAQLARLGSVNLLPNPPEQYSVTYRIVDHYIHPKFSPNYRNNDIVLFKLEVPVEFSPFIRPICLPYDEIRSMKAILTGWRTECKDCAENNILVRRKVNLMTNSDCSRHYQSSKLLPPNNEERNLICSHDLFRGINQCEIYAGAPLQMPIPDRKCMYMQIGITSFGRATCDNQTDVTVYTQIRSYIPWIQSIVWGS